MEQTPTITPESPINDSVVVELKKIEARTGLRFSILEAEYRKFFEEETKTSPKVQLQMRQMSAVMRVDATTQGFNGISNYNIFTLGIRDLPGGRHVLGFTMMQKNDSSGKAIGDPQDMFDPAIGKFGIPTSVVLWRDNISKADNLQDFSFYNFDASPSAPGILRREVRANSFTNFVGINIPIQPEVIQAFLDKTYPILTLAQVKASPSRLLPARVQGARQFVDEHDLKRVQVYITHSACSPRKDGSGEFCSYTVIDPSLSDAEKYNVLNPDGSVKTYGGVQVIVPTPIFKTQNLTDGAKIEVLGTVEMYNEKLQITAVSVKLIAGERRKTPISQKPPAGQQAQGGIKTQSLADLANKGAPPAYI